MKNTKPNTPNESELTPLFFAIKDLKNQINSFLKMNKQFLTEDDKRKKRYINLTSQNLAFYQILELLEKEKYDMNVEDFIVFLEERIHNFIMDNNKSLNPARIKLNKNIAYEVINHIIKKRSKRWLEWEKGI